MSTDSAYLTVRGNPTSMSSIRTSRTCTSASTRRWVVSASPAPLALDDDRVRLAVIQRLPWIQQQREQLQAADRQSEREMVTGESHYVWGVRFRLKVVERPGRTHVETDGERLLL